jgi:transcriptional regulator with XRE-family HTH domain
MLASDNKVIIETAEVFKKKISGQIRKVRRQHRITQEKFYTDTNINIARLESGKIDIRLETLRKICAYFDVSLSGFFQGIY